jgi:catechol 2,3-dioxygenase-like lactoylglutathione lyase family enzyme
MPAAEIRIDHVATAVTDLKTMRPRFEAVTGITMEYGGRHSNHASEMALASFPDGSYIEMIAIQPDADPKAVAAHEWSQFLRRNAGPTAWALSVVDLKAERTRLQATGVRVSEAVPNGRTRPDGVKLSWATVEMGNGPRGAFLPFLIQDFSRRQDRVYPGGKPTTGKFSGVSKVVLGVKDLSAAVSLYRKVYGLGEPRRQDDPAFGAHLAWFEGTPVVLAQAIAADSWLANHVREYGDAPCAWILGSTGASTPGDHSAWFGRVVAWFDAARLGWRLGVESPR